MILPATPVPRCTLGRGGRPSCLYETGTRGQAQGPGSGARPGPTPQAAPRLAKWSWAGLVLRTHILPAYFGVSHVWGHHPSYGILSLQQKDLNAHLD